MICLLKIYIVGQLLGLHPESALWHKTELKNISADGRIKKYKFLKVGVCRR